MSIDTTALLANVDLVALTGVSTRMAAGTHGGEHKGACPLCGGDDRFLAWPDHPSGRGRFWCRRCGRKGDAIDFIRERDGLTFPEAVRALGGEPGQWRPPATAPRSPSPPRAATPPSPRWQERGRLIMERSRARLWEPDSWALAELHRRGLNDETIRTAGLGDNPVTWLDDAGKWGLTGSDIWLPRGIVIPWLAGGELWRLNIRRRRDDLQGGKGPKFIGPRGWAGGNPLYGVDAVTAAKLVILVEGELDALTLRQHAGDLVTPVATGSTGGARCLRWVARLALAPLVLISFDADAAGDEAAKYWLGVLDQARRWRPFWDDVNSMAQAGADVRGWVAAALRQHADSHCDTLYAVPEALECTS